MQRMLTIPLTALTLALAGSAFAAAPTSPTEGTCNSLVKQFDQAVPSHGSDIKIQQARNLRTSGDKACQSGDYKKGVEDLQLALNDIGVKPVMPK